jgi:hypothetical protein
MVKYTSKKKDVIDATTYLVAETFRIDFELDVEITEYYENKRATWRTTVELSRPLVQRLLIP